MNIIINKVSSPEDLQECFKIRRIVFNKEQSVSTEKEFDGNDNIAQHYLLTVDNKPSGTARIRYVNNTAKIERMAILNSMRGKSLGKSMIEYILNDLIKDKELSQIILSAQTHAIAFYEKVGFKICSDQYLDAGIEHRDMIFEKDNISNS
jgi:predicted GNAT family N-acyltransferase